MVPLSKSGSRLYRDVGSNPTLSACPELAKDLSEASKVSRRAMTDREWFFYILRCRDGSLYSGITTDLEARLRAHNRGTGAKYTSGRRPVTLVYSEKCDNASEARKREAEIKGWAKTKKENLVKGLPGINS